MEKNNLTHIQMLRAVAALSVVLSHVLPESCLFPYTYMLGRCGVDIFFVISGFIMVYTQNRNQYSPSRFLLNRIIRILPLYWALTLFFIFSHCLMGYILPKGFVMETYFSLHQIVSSLTFTTHCYEETPILLVGWTLELEMLFYVIFSLSLNMRNLNASIFVCMLSMTIIAFVSHQIIIFDFMFGMLIGVLFIHRNVNIGISGFAFFCGVISLLIITMLYMKDDYAATTTIMEPRMLSPIIVPIALTIFGLVNLPQIKNNLLMKLGNASYSIYLSQSFAYIFFYKMLSYIHHSNQFSTMDIILCFCFTTFCGYLVYVFLEKNSQYLLKHGCWLICYRLKPRRLRNMAITTREKNLFRGCLFYLNVFCHSAPRPPLFTEISPSSRILRNT